MVGLFMLDIDALVQSMQIIPEKFVLTYEGYTKKFLDIEIIHIDDKIFKVSQNFLIYRTISLLNIDTDYYGIYTNAKSTPAGKISLQKDLSGKTLKEAWN